MRKKKDFFISPRKIDAADRKFYCQFRDFCREKLQENEDPYFRFGYETFGIILYGFCDG